MPELRIILLVAGVLLIAGIAGFEWWRGRRDRPIANVARDDASTGAAAPRAGAPLPEINVVREPRSAVPETLPVIELRSAEKKGARDSGGIAVSQDVAIDEPFEHTSTQAIFRKHDEPYIGQDDEISEVRTLTYEDPGANGSRVDLRGGAFAHPVPPFPLMS